MEPATAHGKVNGHQPPASMLPSKSDTKLSIKEYLSGSIVATTILLGIVAGVLAGLFAVGGGLVIVPALVWIGMLQREAVATSLAAIIPISISGALTYTLGGDMNWPVALCMAFGMVIGAQIGSWLLSRLSTRTLSWIFTIFLLFLITQQFLVLPQRNATIHFNGLTGILLVVAGALAGIIGVGGGGLLVPELIVIFGAGDLLARGVSVFAMLPGAISGTITNVRHRLVHLIPAFMLGVTAAIVTPLGRMLAKAASPQLNQYLFAVFLIAVFARSMRVSVKKKRSTPRSAAKK